MIGESFWNLPVWLIVVGVTLLLMAGHELGVQIRRRTRHQVLKDLDAEGIGGSYMTASLSLLALLVAFSFGMAVERYNARRALVLEEASSFRSAHRLVQAIEPQRRSVVSRDLLEYLAVREAFSRSETMSHLADAETRTEIAQHALWSDLIAADGAADFSTRAAMAAVDRLFNVAAARNAALAAVVPSIVLIAVLSYAVTAATLMGYSHRADRRYLVTSTVQFALLGVALGLIVDLDRPRAGMVRVSQEPLLRAAGAIRREEAGDLVIGGSSPVR